jgi:hypothetical protein
VGVSLIELWSLTYYHRRVLIEPGIYLADGIGVNATQFDIDPVQSYQCRAKGIKEYVSLQSNVVIILIIGTSKLHSFLRGKCRARGLSKNLTDTYYALRRHLPSNIAPGFDSFPLSSSAIRKDDEKQTRRPLLETELVDLRI